MTDLTAPPETTASPTLAAQPEEKQAAKQAANAAEIAQNRALLEQLSQWYPLLFGPKLLPLKRGIFHDLLAAHGPAIHVETLKRVLAKHTRSTRYLSAIAAGQARHDLQGQAVEAVAPEHLYLALHEVFRRRQRHTAEDLTPQLRLRIVRAFQASGLTREAYSALVRSRNEQANAVLDQALLQAAEEDAKAEALLRSYEASGCTHLARFAEMYGLHPRAVARQLHLAQRIPLRQTTQSRKPPHA